MDHFNYQNGELHAENVPLSTIAKSVSTPCYVYSAATILRHVNTFDTALAGIEHKIFYSVKANSNQAVLSLLAKSGVGMDVVSIGEYKRAVAAGVDTSMIVFSGVGKTRAELRHALVHGIYQFNVESENELEALNEIAVSLGVRAPISLRVNPDVDAQTHAKISTGKAENKFGIPIDLAPQIYARAGLMKGIEIKGVDTHIGSQLTSLAPFEQAFEKIKTLALKLRADGHNIERIDLGGGLGIPYVQSNENPPLPMDYGKMVTEKFKDMGVEIGIEPGRMIMGNAGILLASVIYLKRAVDRNFLILDAAMNDLIRPAMYDAHHDIIPVHDRPNTTKMDIVGPVCETGDLFAKSRDLPDFAEGDLVAIRTAGAYGAVMASEYNTRPLIPEVLVSGDRFDLIRKRPSVEEIIARDIVPDWLVAQ